MSVENTIPKDVDQVIDDLSKACFHPYEHVTEHRRELMKRFFNRLVELSLIQVK